MVRLGSLPAHDDGKVGARVYREESVQERAEPEGEGNLERGPTKKELERKTNLFLKGFDRAAFSFNTSARVHDNEERERSCAVGQSLKRAVVRSIICT